MNTETAFLKSAYALSAILIPLVENPLTKNLKKH